MRMRNSDYLMTLPRLPAFAWPEPPNRIRLLLGPNPVEAEPLNRLGLDLPLRIDLAGEPTEGGRSSDGLVTEAGADPVFTLGCAFDSVGILTQSFLFGSQTWSFRHHQG